MATTTKGWRKRVYKRTTKRRAQLKKFGPQCFLEPGTGERGSRPKYPVCSKKSGRPTCGGILAAFERARMQRNRKIMNRALRAAKKNGCRWATDY